MSDEEINIAIAEACGWTGVEEDYIYYGFTREIPMKRTRWKEPNSKKSTLEPPNYCSDLNAMYDAENWIIANKSFPWLFQDYAQNLRNFQTLGLDGYIHSTASQRAEAFLRAIGKWKEEAK